MQGLSIIVIPLPFYLCALDVRWTENLSFYYEVSEQRRAMFRPDVDHKVLDFEHDAVTKWDFWGSWDVD